MKIKSLTTSGIKCPSTDGDLTDLGDINLIEGDNGTGKTSKLDGVMLALTGAHPIGKTNKAIMELCRGDRLEASAVLTDGRILTTEFVRKGASVKQTAGKDSGKRFINAADFIDASARGRFGMLGAMVGDGDGDIDEKLIKDAQAELALDVKELKRMTASRKTTALELGKLETAAADEETVKNAGAFNDERLVLRNEIAGLSEPGRNLGEASAELNDDYGTDQDLANLLANQQIKVNRMREIVPQIPTEEDVAQTTATEKAASEEVDQLEAMLGEWEVSGARGKVNDIRDQLASVGDAVDAIESSVQSLKGCEGGECPTCKQDVTTGHMAAMEKHVMELREKREKLNAELSDLECPVSGQELANAQRRLERAKAARVLMLSALEKRAEVATLEEDEATLQAMHVEAANRKLTHERSRYKAASARLAELGEWFKENAEAVEAAKEAATKRVELERLDKSIEKLSEDNEKQKATIVTMREKYEAACARALGKVLESSRNLLTDIVAGNVINYGSDIFIERGEAVIPWGAMSGAEQLAIGAAIKAAVSTVEGILLVDEIGVLSAPNRAQFIKNIAAEIKAGRLEQAFVVVPTEKPLTIETLSA